MHCVNHMTYSIYSSGCSSLEMIVGLESNSKIFTVSVQGLLELQVSSTPSRTNRKNLYLFNIFFITVVFYLSLCRPDSTPPYSWITQRVPPSQYRTVQISWACCSAYSLTHEQGHHPSCPLLPLSFFYFIFFFQWTAYEHHHTVPNHRGGLKEGSEADIDLTACQTVKGQCEELKD